jgi:serine/threonine protein kinase
LALLNANRENPDPDELLDFAEGKIDPMMSLDKKIFDSIQKKYQKNIKAIQYRQKLCDAIVNIEIVLGYVSAENFKNRSEEVYKWESTNEQLLDFHRKALCDVIANIKIALKDFPAENFKNGSEWLYKSDYTNEQLLDYANEQFPNTFKVNQLNDPQKIKEKVQRFFQNSSVRDKTPQRGVPNSLANLENIKEANGAPKKLGGGAFGDVYLYENKQTGQKYAVKFLKEEQKYWLGYNEYMKDYDEYMKDYEQKYGQPAVLQAADQAGKKAVQELKVEAIKEASFASNLKKRIKGESALHALVTGQFAAVGVIDQAENPETRMKGFALIQEYVGIEDLTDRIRQEVNDPLRAINLGLEFIAQIRALVEQGIIHRDLKPPNIRSDEDNAYIIDFGLAAMKNVNDAAAGTPNYMAPEILEAYNRGEKIAPDASQDVYSMAIVLPQIIFGSLCNSSADNALTRLLGLSGFSNLDAAAKMNWIKTLRENQKKQGQKTLKYDLLMAFAEVNHKLEHSYPYRIVEAMANIIGDCLNSDPSRRPSIAKVYSRWVQVYIDMDLCLHLYTDIDRYFYW